VPARVVLSYYKHYNVSVRLESRYVHRIQHTLVQPHHTATKYNIILILIQVHVLGEESHSPKTPLFEVLRVRIPGRGKTQSERRKGGFGPWVATGSRGGVPPLGGLESGRPQGGGGREEGVGPKAHHSSSDDDQLM